jgi:hypothetical protein
MTMRYQIECLDPYALQPFGIMNDGFADTYADAVEKLRDYADYYRDKRPVIFRLVDTQTNTVLDIVLVNADYSVHRFRAGNL